MTNEWRAREFVWGQSNKVAKYVVANGPGDHVDWQVFFLSVECDELFLRGGGAEPEMFLFDTKEAAERALWAAKIKGVIQ
jgi:hypothetical protein